MSIKVLVTGAGALLGQGVIRSMRAAELDVHIVSCDPSPLSAGLYWSDAQHLIPMAKDPAYMPRVREVLAAERPDAVFVGTDVELLIFAEQRAALEAEFGTHILVSDPRVIGIADDKYLTYEFLKEHGFDHPASCLPGDEETLIDQVGFPLIVKPRVGARSVGVYKCDDRVQLKRALEQGGSPVIQECVADADCEYTAGAVCFDGRCDATIVMRRDLRDGNTYRAYVEPYGPLNKAVAAMAEALNPYGPANFQFRLDGDRVKVFEINGRFSGTTPLRRYAGFDEVRMCLEYMVHGRPVTQPAIEPITILRHWSETIVRSSELIG